MEEKSPVYLVMVTTNNNNKYYRMIPHGDTFEAEYGRVGASCQHASYSMSQWNKKYNEKIKKGYVDQTHLVQDLIQKEKPKGKDGYKEIENKVIAEIVQRLQDMAHQKIQANYKVSSQQVTQAMVDEAQKVIDKLMQREEVEDFDSKYYDFNYERLQKTCPGANCLHAHAGSMLRNDEIIVYKEDQYTIKYLVELR